MNLLQNVTSTVSEVCKRLKTKESSSNLDLVQNGRVVPNSVLAVKNGRRKMEDRHVVLHDLNLIYSQHLPKVRKEYFSHQLNP